MIAQGDRLAGPDAFLHGALQHDPRFRT
jgi:hypothetical protein